MTWLHCDCSAAHTATSSSGATLGASDGSAGAGSTSSPLSWRVRIVRIISASPKCTAAAASTTVCCGGMPRRTATSPNCTSASTSATGSSRCCAMHTATLIATVLLPTPPLGENTTTSRPGSTRPPDGDGQAGRRVRQDLTDAGDGLRERVAVLLELDGVACTRTERLLEQVGGQLGHDEHRAELGVRRRQAVDLLEAERTDEPGAEHGDERTAGAQLLHHVLDRVELLRARQLQTQPHPEAGVGFDHRRVVAGLLRNCVRAPVFHRQLHRYVRVSARERELRFPTPNSKGVPGRGTASRPCSPARRAVRRSATPRR